jgi:hypothetical protein
MHTTESVSITDANTLPWRLTANPGLALKPIREDQALGLFLGLVRFEPFTRSGLHQHQGVATSFVVDGGLTDYHGAIGLHQAGINIKGSTHDAVAYQHTVLISRLEGPVTYPPKSDISGVHSGSRYESFGGPDPLIPPEINVDVDAQAHYAHGYEGVKAQMIFDYAGTGSAHRMVQLYLAPGTSLKLTATALTEYWVRGGLLEINGQAAHANCFIQCKANTELEIHSPFGALLLAWAEGPEANAFTGQRDLFGFHLGRTTA